MGILDKWRRELFEEIGERVAAVVRELLTKFFDGTRDDLKQIVRETLPTKDEITGAIDRITDAIPGALDDRVIDGLVGKIIARIPFLGGSR
ncbi:hypothetical protein [Mycobacteroides abscessus]|uniref:hypothetical protein n=1 Tax=Mycobacteroides abscessus TaxID=36809 RepID=UPI00092BBAD4|nr:hypothetical protein [Mycobacteroides abscessus]DAZ90362.1 TPA_asm: hypothetical protein PROPHIFSQJ01-1_76 [Mycobacterium phage prophiFSQJ01-1]SII41672.1 Uncharacterised protein [Mycobacteroides abscessus subsp. abscessus]SIK13462.1 Uncharacterised protein [Mycobacteroides abscessus subsp. abscessus]SIN25781.1 Uncharacterised protein [Mycobacteroides abscessus subsp. abscessus]SLI51166.1 Uncharacterised protein [Mycobacteroides abscessus subsp. abscessus]